MEEMIRCPFVSALNPGTDAAHRHTQEWATKHGLIRNANIEHQMATEQFTWLVGRFYPRAQPPELELISDFTSWLFWHDDVCDETTLGEEPGALARQFDWLLGILTRRKPARPGDAFDRAFVDLRDRFERFAPSHAWLARFVVALQQYFDGCVWEARNRKSGAVPSVETFTVMRRFASAMYVYLELVELVARAELPLVARGNPDVIRLRDIANNVAAWHNDLFSLDKELAYGDVHNVVAVLAKENGIGLAEAKRAATALCNAEVAAFEAIAAGLRSFGADQDLVVAAYVENLKALMRGNLDWSLATDRYQRVYEPQAKADYAT